MCGRIAAKLPELKWMRHVANCWSIIGCTTNKQPPIGRDLPLYDVLFQFIINKKLLSTK